MESLLNIKVWFGVLFVAKKKKKSLDLAFLQSLCSLHLLCPAWEQS